MNNKDVFILKLVDCLIAKPFQANSKVFILALFLSAGLCLFWGLYVHFGAT